METSVEAAEVLLPPPEEVSPPDPDHLAASPSSSRSFDPMLEFSRRLEHIIGVHGSAAGLLDGQNAAEAETETMEDSLPVVTETDVSLLRRSLDSLRSPEEQVEQLLQEHAVLAAQRRGDERRLRQQQRQLQRLLEERRQLQEERSSSVAARRELEGLCRELQAYYRVMTEEAVQRCREDEEKRKEITSHFQESLTEIQEQIEQHSLRNDKLCGENSNLTEKLESLMEQCERREESLEKVNKHRDLQHQLAEARLQRADAALAEAEDRHRREKEYLLREAIDKTKKCFAMKEQELAMKKKLTLYAQKFDEFQATLAKSNEIYVRFKKEMDNMTEKMKKLEKESNLWKLRFENCNKALTEMIDERSEKGKEYELFVLKIQKLEKLCRALQDERKVLYDKIKDVRHSNAAVLSKVSGSAESSDDPALLSAQEILELEEEDPVLTEDMARLREEQARLQDFAASLLVPSDDEGEEEEPKHELDPEADVVASSFVQFKSRMQVREGLGSAEEPGPTQEVKSEELLNQPESTPETPAGPEAPEAVEAPAGPEAVEAPAGPYAPEAPEDQEQRLYTPQTGPHPDSELQTPVEVGAEEETQQPPEATPEPGRPEPGTEDEKVRLQRPTQVPEESGPPAEDTSKPSPSSKKQAPKKKKKSSKSAS